jgi:undecaprenyl-diphosphatase
MRGWPLTLLAVCGILCALPALTIPNAPSASPPPPPHPATSLPMAHEPQTLHVCCLPVTYYFYDSARYHGPPRFPLTHAQAPLFEDNVANIAIFRVINGARTAFLDLLMAYLLFLGKAWVLIPVALLLWRYRRDLLIPVFSAQLFAGVVAFILKTLFSQPRPGALVPDLTLLENVYTRSFPSADVALAFALAFALFPYASRWGKVGLVAYALFIGYERMYVGAHFPLDVLVGMLIGLTAAFLVNRFLPQRDISGPSDKSDLSDQPPLALCTPDSDAK